MLIRKAFPPVRFPEYYPGYDPLSRTAIATDWCGYRGPNQDGISNETVNLNWTADGPKVVWKAATKNGFSSFAVVGGKAFTLVNRDLHGSPGKSVWHWTPRPARSSGWPTSPSARAITAAATATARDPRRPISEGLVYTFTPDLVLHCHDAETGKTVWTKDLIKEHAGHNIGWNNAASPVIDGDLVFVAGGGPGQSLLGIAKKTGKVAWKTGSETMTHAMPVVGTILGQRQVIFFCKSGLVAVATDSGKELWRFPYDYKTATAVSPVICGDIVYCSAGYGIGGGACKITKNGARFIATELIATSNRFRTSGVRRSTRTATSMA